jgi:hypothetical protein
MDAFHKRLFGDRPGRDASPADSLRWVRRATLVVAALALPGAAIEWATNGSPSWPLLAALGMTLLGAILLTPAIRSIERQGAHPVDRD